MKKDLTLDPSSSRTADRIESQLGSELESESFRADSYAAALPGKPWEKRRRVLRFLFEKIEPRYDRLNRILSLGIDQSWRRWTARSVTEDGPWLDLASGTGDLAECLYPRLLERQSSSEIDRANPRWLLRGDLCSPLLKAGSNKIGEALLSPGIACEMDRLPLPESSVGAITQGFALRHCRDYAQFFSELSRVLRPGGQIAILDMRYPRSGFGSGLYRIYFRHILPTLARICGADIAAYRFMVDSVRSMPGEERFLELLEGAGFERTESRRGFLGAVQLLVAYKPGGPYKPRG